MDSVSKLETIYEPWSKERPVDGQVVQINLLVCFEDGTEVEDSRKRTPICFVLGSMDVIEGINIAVRGFGQGERSKVKICSELAYGEKITCLASTLNIRISTHLPSRIRRAFTFNTSKCRLDL
jgi:FKBP-type peptidyl-prolyl cis-trans isomerase 2